MPITLSKLKIVVNMSDGSLFLSASTLLCTISYASVTLANHFKEVFSDEINISTQPNTVKRVNVCPVDLSNVIGNDN